VGLREVDGRQGRVDRHGDSVSVGDGAVNSAGESNHPGVDSRLEMQSAYWRAGALAVSVIGLPAAAVQLAHGMGYQILGDDYHETRVVGDAVGNPVGGHVAAATMLTDGDWDHAVRNADDATTRAAVGGLAVAGVLGAGSLARSVDELDPIPLALARDDFWESEVAALERSRVGGRDAVDVAPVPVGAGGSWRVHNEAAGRAVGQTRPDSCVAACGEMLTGRTQSDLIARIDSPATIEDLARELGDGWRGGYVDPSDLDRLGARGPFGATLYDGGQLHHMVVVDRVSDDAVAILDPANGGTSYQMAREEFLRVWTGGVVFR